MSDYPGLRRASNGPAFATGFRGAMLASAAQVEAAESALRALSGEFEALLKQPFRPRQGDSFEALLKQPFRRMSEEERAFQDLLKQPFKRPGRYKGPSPVPQVPWRGRPWPYRPRIGFSPLDALSLYFDMRQAEQELLADELAQAFVPPPGMEVWIECEKRPEYDFQAALSCAALNDPGYIMDEVYPRGNPYWSPPRWYSSWYQFAGFDVLGRRLFWPARMYRGPVQETMEPAPEREGRFYPFPIPIEYTAPEWARDPMTAPHATQYSQPPLPTPYRRIPELHRRQEYERKVGIAPTERSESGPDTLTKPEREPPRGDPPTTTREPPGPGTSEGKGQAPKVMRAAKALLEKASEGCDAVAALHKALPRELQTRSTLCTDRFVAVYRNMKNINLCEGIQNLINNEFQDRAISFSGKMQKKNAQLGGTKPMTDAGIWKLINKAMKEHDPDGGTMPWVPSIDLHCDNPDQNPTFEFAGMTWGADHFMDVWNGRR